MYNIVLFLHLVGVVLLVGAVTVSLLATLRAQTAGSVAELRSLTRMTRRLEVALAPAMVIIIASGLYMVSQHTAHGGIPWLAGWVLTSIAVTVLLAIIGNTVEARDAKRLHAAIARSSGDTPPAELRQLQRASRPIYVVFFGASQIVALLFLMTNKPGLVVSIVACLIAAGVSAVAALLRARAVRRSPLR